MSCPARILYPPSRPSSLPHCLPGAHWAGSGDSCDVEGWGSLGLLHLGTPPCPGRGMGSKLCPPHPLPMVPREAPVPAAVLEPCRNSNSPRWARGASVWSAAWVRKTRGRTRHRAEGGTPGHLGRAEGGIVTIPLPAAACDQRSGCRPRCCCHRPRLHYCRRRHPSPPPQPPQRRRECSLAASRQRGVSDVYLMPGSWCWCSRPGGAEEVVPRKGG